MDPSEINQDTLLSDVRKKIETEFIDAPNLPSNFLFVFLDGVPVAMIQESRLRASRFLPTIYIRPVERSLILSPRPPRTSTDFGVSREPEGDEQKQQIRVRVVLSTSNALAAGVTAECDLEFLQWVPSRSVNVSHSHITVCTTILSQDIFTFHFFFLMEIDTHLDN